MNTVNHRSDGSPCPRFVRIGVDPLSLRYLSRFDPKQWVGFNVDGGNSPHYPAANFLRHFFPLSTK